MAGIFRPGQLVGLEALIDCEGTTSLYSVPGGDDDVRVIGWLNADDVALVVAVGRGGGAVYVVGPHGSGWTFGAMLKALPSSVNGARPTQKSAF